MPIELNRWEALGVLVGSAVGLMNTRGEVLINQDIFTSYEHLFVFASTFTEIWTETPEEPIRLKFDPARLPQ